MDNEDYEKITDIWELEHVDANRQLENSNVNEHEDPFTKEKTKQMFSLRHLFSNKHLTAKYKDGKLIACLA